MGGLTRVLGGRAVQALLVALLVGTACFLMVRLLPGDMAYRIAASRYGYDIVDSAAAEAVRQGGDVVVRFRNVTGGLQRYGGAGAIGFEQCAGATCSYVDGRVQGDTVVLPGAGRPEVTAVRYAWADAPFVNLFDGADLPAAPFELPVR